MDISQYIQTDGYAQLPSEMIPGPWDQPSPEFLTLRQAVREHNDKLADERTAAYNWDMNELARRVGAEYGRHPEYWAIMRHKEALEAPKIAARAARAPEVLKRDRKTWTTADWESLVAAGLARHDYDDVDEQVVIRYRLNDDVQRKINDGIDDWSEENLAKLGL